MSRILVTILLAGTLVPAAAFAATGSGFDGTWRADLSTLHMSGKPMALLVANGMYACMSCVPKVHIKADGQPQAVTGDPYADHITVTVKNDRSISQAWIKDGQTNNTLTWTVAPDGKMATHEFSFRTANGSGWVSEKYEFRRVRAAPKGANLVSGAWMPNNMSVPQSARTVTYDVSGDVLTMTNPIGNSFTAPLDGKPAAYKGDPGITTVSVKMNGKDELIETDMHSGKVVAIRKSTLSPDGKTVKVNWRDITLDHHAVYTMARQ